MKKEHRYRLLEAASKIKGNGCFVECGVKNGSTAWRVVQVLRRPAFLFDTWARFEGFTSKDGSRNRKRRLYKRDGSKREKICRAALRKHGVDDLCTMVKGDVRKTLPKFLSNQPEVCFAHLDLDLYEPTKICLNSLWEFMTGPIFIHDYDSSTWKGITECVNDFVAARNIRISVYPKADSCIIHK